MLRKILCWLVASVLMSNSVASAAVEADCVWWAIYRGACTNGSYSAYGTGVSCCFAFTGNTAEDEMKVRISSGSGYVSHEVAGSSSTSEDGYVNLNIYDLSSSFRRTYVTSGDKIEAELYNVTKAEVVSGTIVTLTSSIAWPSSSTIIAGDALVEYETTASPSLIMDSIWVDFTWRIDDGTCDSTNNGKFKFIYKQLQGQQTIESPNGAPHFGFGGNGIQGDAIGKWYGATYPHASSLVNRTTAAYPVFEYPSLSKKFEWQVQLFDENAMPPASILDDNEWWSEDVVWP